MPGAVECVSHGGVRSRGRPGSVAGVRGGELPSSACGEERGAARRAERRSGHVRAGGEGAGPSARGRGERKERGKRKRKEKEKWKKERKKRRKRKEKEGRERERESKGVRAGDNHGGRCGSVSHACRDVRSDGARGAREKGDGTAVGFGCRVRKRIRGKKGSGV